MARFESALLLLVALSAFAWRCARAQEGGAGSTPHCGQESARHFSNEWVVRVQGGPRAARALADEMGYDFRGHVLGFEDTYRMVKSDHPRKHKRAHSRLTERLAADARVVWAEQQFAKRRVKRSPPPAPDPRPRPRPRRGDLSVPTFRTQEIFNDELWPEQWYLQDTRERPELPRLDLHVLPLYARGLSGRGVRVSILDDGIERLHDDLRRNYDAAISYDANDDDWDPTPRYDPARSNAHGTRCAGEVAMAADNGKCGVGVAFNARVGGVRLLDGEVNDRVEGVSLAFAHRLVDIYSASWGPNDDGRTVEGPGALAAEAMEKGIREGRGGRGAIYVWASGNGGSRGDNCDCDGYIGSRYTLAVGSASQRGQFPWYGERCAATMAATYSSGAYSDQMIATTDLGNTCTVKHTGTSASAPLAAGIIALALETNPELTWRDVQHLVAWTSEYGPLSDNAGWRRSASGFWISTRFGFGLMNAAALVAQAVNWTTVPPAALCVATATRGLNATLRAGGAVAVELESDGCVGGDAEVNFLEHVQAQVTIQYPVRGHLHIVLTSPSGTRVQLLGPRRLDTSSEGFTAWRFLSVLTWGERARGKWRLEVRAMAEPGAEAMAEGRVGECLLLLHGTRDPPAHYADGPRNYDAHYNDRLHRKKYRQKRRLPDIATDSALLLQTLSEADDDEDDDRVATEAAAAAAQDVNEDEEGNDVAKAEHKDELEEGFAVGEGAVELDVLQQQKGSAPLEWGDLQGLELALRRSQDEQDGSLPAHDRKTTVRRWLEEFVQLLFA